MCESVFLLPLSGWFKWKPAGTPQAFWGIPVSALFGPICWVPRQFLWDPPSARQRQDDTARGAEWPWPPSVLEVKGALGLVYRETESKALWRVFFL